jgi:membrane-associated phospholipid phosphatase
LHTFCRIIIIIASITFRLFSMKFSCTFRKSNIWFLSGIYVVFLAFIPFSAQAEDTGEYHLDLIKDSALTVSGLSFVLIGSGLISHVHAPDPSALERGDIPGIDRIALDRNSKRAGNYSNITLEVCSFLPFLTAASVLSGGENKSTRQAIAVLAMYAESSLLAGGLTQIAKGAFHRSRPYAYDHSFPLASRETRDSSLSFFSGHASTAFNGAVFACSVYQRQHPQSKLIIPFWAFGLSTAAATAFLRVEAGVHFPTDVVAGAAVGSFTGWLVPRLHEKTPKRFEVITNVVGFPGCGFQYHF